MSARVDPRRVAPTLLAGALAALYVIVSPPSLDLAAHVFRAQLFRSEGFALWNNWWYAGHHIVGYSVLFPAVSAALSPQLAAAIAATATAAVFEPLAHRRYGADAWLGALVFGAATATSLFTGRLAFAFGALPAVAAILALDRGRTWLAASLAALAALCSPVAALFAALGAAAHALGSYLAERELRVAWPGIAVAIAAIAPLAAFAVAFPEGGSEPFAFAALWPIPLLALGTLLALPAGEQKLRAGVALYTLATIACYLVPSPVGSNAARLGTFFAAPLAALLWWPRKVLLLVLAAAPLLYLEWQAPIRDLVTAVDDPSYSADYYEPLLRFLGQQTGPPFRVEVPFTRFHWEAYAVASRYPIARGWERQLDIEDNALFYRGHLTAAAYEAWLHREAVRFVAAADAPLDYSAEQEMALIDRGLPYLRLAMRTAHWRVYEVSDPTPIVQGAATLRAIGGDWLSLYAGHTGSALVRVRFTPYWKLAQGAGCVSRAGQFTRVTIRRPGSLRLVASFSLGRIGASSPRCS